MKWVVIRCGVHAFCQEHKRCPDVDISGLGIKTINIYTNHSHYITSTCIN